jgi:hypothetical protein
MTYTEQAIKKAIEGGFDVRWNPAFGAAEEVSKDGNGTILHNQQVFLDPSFWQSLGKTLGWNGRWMVQIFTDHDDQSATVEGAGRWKYEWHRFIDHLAEGKDVENYFESLLK